MSLGNKLRLADPTDLRPWAIVPLVALLAIGLDLGLNHLLAKSFRVNQELGITRELTALGTQLERQVNAHLSVATNLAAILSALPDLSTTQLGQIAQVLLNRNRSIKLLTIAPEFVVTYIHSLTGNQDLVGQDIRKLPDHWRYDPSVEKTKDRGATEPIQLILNAGELTAHCVLFDKESQQARGVVSLLVDFEQLLKQIGFHSSHPAMQIALRAKGTTAQPSPIRWGDARVFEPEVGAITLPISLPSETWQLAALPQGGWKKDHPYQWIIHFIMLIMGAMGGVSVIDHYQSKRALEENENRLKSMSDASHDALIMIDSDGLITFWNPAAEAMFEYSATEVLGKSLHHLIATPEDRQKAEAGLKQFAHTGQGPVMSKVLEMEAIRKSGDIFPVERSVAPFRLRGKWYAVGSVRDITIRKQFETQLKQLATTDSLTGLANRRSFMEQAEKQLQLAIRYEKHLSIMIFDLDHFKQVNDTYGHDGGDQVLRVVADIVRQVLRNTDIVGRIGGEEFAAVMPETDLSVAEKVAERLRTGLMAAEIQTQTATIGITISLGLTQVSDTNITLAELMKRADDALYQAKRSGRNRFVAID